MYRTILNARVIGGLFLMMSMVSGFSARADLGLEQEKQRVASRQDPQRYFGISKVEIKELFNFTGAPNFARTPEYAAIVGGKSVDPCAANAFPGLHSQMLDLSTFGVILDQIINIGAKLWQVADSQKAVVTISGVSANALPQGAGCWNTLQAWQVPVARTFNLKYTNGLDMETLNFTYRVGYTYGGNYRGQGRYITNAFINAENLSVAWGFHFDSQAQVTSVVNLGSSKNPIAGMQLELSLHLTSLFSNSQKTDVFFVRGDGGFTRLP